MVVENKEICLRDVVENKEICARDVVNSLMLACKENVPVEKRCDCLIDSLYTASKILYSKKISGNEEIFDMTAKKFRHLKDIGYMKNCTKKLRI